MDKLNYGNIIKAARESRNMTQSVLGAKVGVGKTSICNYVNGGFGRHNNNFMCIRTTQNLKDILR